VTRLAIATTVIPVFVDFDEFVGGRGQQGSKDDLAWFLYVTTTDIDENPNEISRDYPLLASLTNQVFDAEELKTHRDVNPFEVVLRASV
jgi:hypothetical protein